MGAPVIYGEGLGMTQIEDDDDDDDDDNDDDKDNNYNDDYSKDDNVFKEDDNDKNSTQLLEIVDENDEINCSSKKKKSKIKCFNSKSSNSNQFDNKSNDIHTRHSHIIGGGNGKSSNGSNGGNNGPTLKQCHEHLEVSRTVRDVLRMEVDDQQSTNNNKQTTTQTNK